MLLFAVLLSSVYVSSLLVSVSLLLSSLSSNVVTSFDCDSKRIVLSVYVVVDLIVVSDSVGVVFILFPFDGLGRIEWTDDDNDDTCILLTSDYFDRLSSFILRSRSSLCSFWETEPFVDDDVNINLHRCGR